MRLAVNGVQLHLERSGSGHPLLLLHGFTGSAASWAALAPRLGERAGLVAVDLIGHGRSEAPVDWARYSFEHAVADLLALLDRLGLARVDLLGYSLGGRVALHLATAAPERIRGLVLESASPGLAEPGERAARVASDLALAEAIERDGLTAFVDRWQRLPLFASQASLPPATRTALRAQRLRGNPRGLANSLRGMGAGCQEPLWERLPTLRLPTLLVVGALDQKYCGLGQQMAAHLPNARLVVVPGAGHTVHLERPAEFSDAVLGFLGGLAATTPPGAPNAAAAASTTAS